MDRPEGQSPESVTVLLARLREGDRDALDGLFPLVYGELRQLAHARMRHERPDHTLSTTALVHEAYLRLVDQRNAGWENRSHFFAIAAQAMRRILVNHAEARRAAKRGGGAVHVELEGVAHLLPEERDEELLALHEALERLAAFNERGARIVEYHYFGGLSQDEIADVMGISPATVRRAWTAARSWLGRELRATATDPSAPPP